MYLRVPINTELFKNPAQILYRNIIKHIPRVIALYDLPIDEQQARETIRWHFMKNATIKDPRVIDMLLTKASMEVEETLMQWKQRVHLLQFFTSLEKKSKYANENEEILAKFLAGDFTEEEAEF